MFIMKRVLKDHFIPHAGNDYAPHILQKAAMIAMLFLVLLSFTMANLQALIWVNVDWLVSSILPAVVVSETNEERADGALGDLARSATLDRAAQLKAEHMAELGYFAHYAPDGTSPWYWFRAVNYSFVHAGENLAVHFNDSNQVVNAWMNSPTHRANIMNGDYTEIGIGVAEGEFEGQDTIFVVQLFGTPAAAPAVATVPTPTESVTVVTEQVSEPTIVASAEEAAQVAAAEETIIEAPVTEPVAAPVADTVLPVTTPEALAELTAELEEVAVATETPTTTEAEAPVVVAQDQFISTSTAGVPARTVSVPTTAPSEPGIFALATSPQLVLQWLYLALGLFVIGALLLSIAVEARRHRPVQIAYSFGLLIIMGGLYYIQSIVTHGATIL